MPPSASSKRPFARLVGAGVGTGFGAEQFGLDQFARQRAAVDRDERPVRTAELACTIDAMRSLPAPFGPVISTGTSERATWQARSSVRAMASEANTSPSRSYLRCSASRRLRRSWPTRVHFAGGFGQLQQVLHRGQQLGVIPRLGQVIGGTGLDQLHRGFQMRPGGEQDHRQVGMALPDGAGTAPHPLRPRWCRR